MKLPAPFALLALGTTLCLEAVPVTHTGQDLYDAGVGESLVGNVLVSSIGGAAAPWGVNYAFGGAEALFDDFPYAIGGVNSLLEVDLLGSISGQIVVVNSSIQGLTSYIQVEAGFADPGTLLLEVFDISGNVIATSSNSADDGPNGRSLLTIDRVGVFDIASFTISTPGGDDFGVTQVTIETPSATAAVPEAVQYSFPLALGLLAALRARWPRRR